MWHVCVLLVLLTTLLLRRRDPGPRLAAVIGLIACMVVLVILFMPSHC